jgi:hypothetical protein
MTRVVERPPKNGAKKQSMEMFNSRNSKCPINLHTGIRDSGVRIGDSENEMRRIQQLKECRFFILLTFLIGSIPLSRRRMFAITANVAVPLSARRPFSSSVVYMFSIFLFVYTVLLQMNLFRFYLQHCPRFMQALFLDYVLQQSFPFPASFSLPFK